jgi:hypothetical protein
MLGVQMLEERHTPPAACACGEALADEARDPGVLALEIAADFSQRDVEAEADFVIFVHRGLPSRG